MRKIGDFWVPDEDCKEGLHLQRSRESFENRGGCQIHHLEEALSHVDRWTLAIDAGANIGSWSRVMATRFKRVEAFEPHPSAYACLCKNIESWGMKEIVTPHRCALSNDTESVAISCGDARTVCARVVGPGDITTRPIDSFQLSACDFLKLDVEGFEARALIGAQRTIQQFSPVILMENKMELNALYGQPDLASETLEKMGYSLIARIGDRQIDWLFKRQS
ncbi:FkbM family methyltransferase [Magnetococcus sp. PR-3]|uniref:FkbM family methyltransferase n=1 Tax=Magnetococcus sp. PR-3 TaxID=3120355 RepID=UPI002FCE4A61